MAIRIGEIQTEITGDVKKAEEVKAVFRLNWGAEVTSKAEFKPANDLKKGDKIKLVIEKL